MAIRTRGKSLQIDIQVTVNGETVRYREAFHGNMEYARQREREIKAALLVGHDPSGVDRTPAPKGLTLGRALDDCFERYWRRGRNRRIMESYVEKTKEFFGEDTLLRDIGTEEIDSYIATMGPEGSSLSPQTIRQRLVPLSKTFTHFVGTKANPELVRPKFRYPARVDNTRTRVLTGEERAGLVRLFREDFDNAVSRRRPEGVPDGADWADLIVFLMDTGVRPSEARSLRKGDLKGDRVYVWRTKTNKPRILPLTDRALEAFERQIHRLPAGEIEPFAWAYKDRISWAWRWARETMGLDRDPGFIPYVLRHDCATRLYALTRDLLLVKEWMGHVTIEMTLRYAKLDPQHLDRAKDLLQGFPVPISHPRGTDDRSPPL